VRKSKLLTIYQIFAKLNFVKLIDAFTVFPSNQYNSLFIFEILFSLFTKINYILFNSSRNYKLMIKQIKHVHLCQDKNKISKILKEEQIHVNVTLQLTSK